MIALLFLLAFTDSGLVTLTDHQTRTIEVDPTRDRAAIHFQVHPSRPTLLVFDHRPDNPIITGDDQRWFVTTPGSGLPGHAFHFKPKKEVSGWVGNAFFFFNGYPLEVVYESTTEIAKATTLVYVVVRGVAARAELTLAASTPKVHQPDKNKTIPARKAIQPRAPPFLDREKRTGFGLLRWATGTEPALVFKPKANMADLTSIEVVRGKRKLLSRSLRYAHPIIQHREKTGNMHVVRFGRVHLTRGERYYARLFFEGSKEPVYLKLTGLKRGGGP